MWAFRFLPIGLLLGWCAIAAASPRTYYVATTGVDTHPGTQGQPLRTIQKAITLAQAGDTVFVTKGFYAERLTLSRSGTATFPITVTGESQAAVIDGSVDTTGLWVKANDACGGSSTSGVWKTTKIGYEPYALTAHGKAIWRINTDSMNGQRIQDTQGDGCTHLRLSPTHTVTRVGVPVQYWDGVGALFGYKSGATYVRFRHKDDPNVQGIRAAPKGAVVTITGGHIVLRNLTIQGGAIAVRLTGTTATHNVVEHTVLLHGAERVVLEQGAASNHIRDNVMTANAIGMQNYPGGDWDSSSYARAVMRQSYNENKFIVGRTREDDTGVRISSSTSSNNAIYRNVITNGIVGIEVDCGCTGTQIYQNTIVQMAAQGLWLFGNMRGTQVYGNLLYDNDHNIRLQETEKSPDVYVYRNCFWEPLPATGGGKHIHLSFSKSTGTATNTIAIYHNSFAGGGWAVDVGGTSEGAKNLPKLFVYNNIVSTRGLSSGGFHQVGQIASNWLHWDYGSTRMWPDTTLPSSFALPDTPFGRSAKDAGRSLILTGWPGVGSDATPDMGAFEGAMTSCGAGE